MVMTRKRHRMFTPIEDLATHSESFLSVGQLARYWNVEAQTVRKWIRVGLLPGLKLGGVLRVKRIDARTFES